MGTHLIRVARFMLVGVCLLTMLGLSCHKTQIAEQKEVLTLRLEHTPVREHAGPGGQEIRARIISSLDLKEGGVKLFYKEKGGDFLSLPMTSMDQADEYSAVIPSHSTGTRICYYIQVSSVTGTPLTLPKNAITSGKTYAFTFKGQVSPFLYVLHFCSVLIGLLLILLAGYWAYLFLKRGEKLEALTKVTLAGAILLLLGGIPLHMAVKYQSLGKIWEGLPIGTDRTDSLTLLLVLFWMGVLFLFKGTFFQKEKEKNFVSDKTFALIVLIGALLTVIVFLIPN
ncbi:MAG: hypothetical protein JSV84_13165 [Gemmatimonadota bacterium]|nr:MAG: hypothetical protein JSV84_13165 [Gemmatimonadota bacterium]